MIVAVFPISNNWIGFCGKQTLLHFKLHSEATPSHLAYTAFRVDWCSQKLISKLITYLYLTTVDRGYLFTVDLWKNTFLPEEYKFVNVTLVECNKTGALVINFRFYTQIGAKQVQIRVFGIPTFNVSCMYVFYQQLSTAIRYVYQTQHTGGL